MEAEVREQSRRYTAGFGVGDTGAASPGMQAASRSWQSLGPDLPQSLPKEHSPASTLILAKCPPPQTCKRISLCCFKPLIVICYSSLRKLIQFQKLRLAFIPATSTLFHPSLIIFKVYLWHILPSLRNIIIHIYVYIHIYVINYINT